jgi:hypothetical protein
LSEAARLHDTTQPVGQILSQPDLHAAHALDTAPPNASELLLRASIPAASNTPTNIGEQDEIRQLVLAKDAP